MTRLFREPGSGTISVEQLAKLLVEDKAHVEAKGVVGAIKTLRTRTTLLIVQRLLRRPSLCA